MNFILESLHSVFGFFYELVFGCHHHRQTRPFTLEAETYKVCLDCGRQIYYSTERMKPLTSREVRHMKAQVASANVVHIRPAASGRKQAAQKNSAAA